MWSLYKSDKKLEPLKFSNGKTQEEIVKEVLSAITEGYKIIFIKGMCGTGKSAIALNLARNLGKASVIVPIKSLQEQYINDYSNKFHLLDKENKKKIKISSIVGRQNFKCKFLEENELPTMGARKEKNAKLTETFEKNLEIPKEKNETCDNSYLPCKIEIREKNSSIIKDYLKKNKEINPKNFEELKDVKRISIAPICPYWCPIFPEDLGISILKDSKKIIYNGLDNSNFIIYKRKEGCSYYNQYEAYADSDVIIFNSFKYRLELLMKRKPKTEIEIIDECDEFLDSYSNQESININRLALAVNTTPIKNSKFQNVLNELFDLTNTIKRNNENSKEPSLIKDTPIENLLRILMDNQDILYSLELDESSYLFHLEEVSRIFNDFLEETYFSSEKIEDELIINLVTINLKKRFQELLEKNNTLVMMSGTIHSEEVLRNIFGLEKFKIIEAETKNQGNLIKCKHGYEIDCKYSNFQTEKISRETYLKAFSKTVRCAKKPVLIQLTSFSDLPTEYEKEKFNIDNLPSQSSLIEEQRSDPIGKRVLDFKNKKTDFLFTTRCSRGVDFPGDICNSIIISKFPYPNISSLFWKVLKKSNPENFMDFYMDKANRELLQRIYRGLRSKDDRLYLLSPDIRVINFNFNSEF